LITSLVIGLNGAKCKPLLPPARYHAAVTLRLVQASTLRVKRNPANQPQGFAELRKVTHIFGTSPPNVTAKRRPKMFNAKGISRSLKSFVFTDGLELPTER
jgi:hypothetical protein